MLQAGGERVPGCAWPFGEPPVKLCPVLGTASRFGDGNVVFWLLESGGRAWVRVG